MRMKKLALSVAVAAAMGLTGCGGSSGGSGSSASSATVNGIASKGIVVGGKVSAYLFDTDGEPETTAIATATTDANGEYSLTVPPAHKGKPLYIVIDDNAGTASMKCDLAPKCDKDGDGEGDVDFGESFDLGAGDLEMSAVLPESTAKVSVNITPLTTVAASLAKKTISEGSVSEFNIKEAMTNANSQVANRFGLSGEITKQPVVDLTNTVKVAASVDNAEALKYAALNSAIVSAVQADALKNIGEAVQDFAEDYAENGLVDNALTESKTDLSEILDQAYEVLNDVQKLVKDSSEGGDEILSGLEDILDDIEDEYDVASDSEASDEGDVGTASPTATGEKLAQVKAFVEELRELGTAIEGSVIGSGESAQTVEALAENFNDQLDAADFVSSDDVGYSVEALGEALRAIVAVYENNFDMETGDLLTPSEDTITDLTSEATVDYDGVSVKVAKVDGVVKLSVDQNITITDDDQSDHVVAVDVSSTVTDLSIVETKTKDEDLSNPETGTEGWEDQGNGSGSVNISIVGTAEADNANVSLLEGSSVKANGVFSFEGREINTENSSSWNDYLDFKVTGFDLELNVKIDQTEAFEKQTGGLMTFTGSLDAEISSAQLIEESSGDWEYTPYSESQDWSDTYTEDEDTSIRLGAVSIVLSGEFKNDVDSFDARFSLDGNGKNINYHNIYSFSDQSSAEGYSYEESSESTGETSSSYSNATVKLDFTADLAGISADGSEEIDFSFEATRTGYDDGEVSVSLRYPGRTIDIVADASALDTENSAKGELTLTNNDGVQIVVTGDDSKDDGEDVTVEIRMDTNEDGKINSDDFLFGWYEVRNGVELLVFADDKDSDNIEFESLF